MAKTTAAKSAAPKGERAAGDFPKRSALRSKVQRYAETGDFAGSKARVEAVMSAAEPVYCAGRADGSTAG
jgi:hypothetical protein